jgi:hypothetical protein
MFWRVHGLDLFGIKEMCLGFRFVEKLDQEGQRARALDLLLVLRVHSGEGLSG